MLRLKDKVVCTNMFNLGLKALTFYIMLQKNLTKMPFEGEQEMKWQFGQTSSLAKYHINMHRHRPTSKHLKNQEHKKKE